MNDIQKLLFEMYERPQDFTLSEFTITHSPSQQQFWIANGRRCYRMYRPYKIEFTYADQWRFHRAFKWWKRGARKEQRFWLRNWLCEQTVERMKATETA